MWGDNKMDTEKNNTGIGNSGYRNSGNNNSKTIMINQVIQGDCLEILKSLPDR